MASARAMQMRWRWPPENWCGKRVQRVRVEPDQAHQLARALDRVASRLMPKFTGPSMIAAPTVRRGLSER